ncbi:hypothetical protein F5Y15DRAFT_419669 [Xylariaceae sp. FL0016]|nr:hypothetical protein F5Y15DRAFT_419669 [Xylariaceae sp. FL0016]
MVGKVVLCLGLLAAGTSSVAIDFTASDLTRHSIAETTSPNPSLGHWILGDGGDQCGTHPQMGIHDEADKARTQDCEWLKTWLTGDVGYWEANEWKAIEQAAVVIYNTCTFSNAVADLPEDVVRIGSRSLTDLLRYILKQASGFIMGDYAGAWGNIDCWSGVGPDA